MKPNITIIILLALLTTGCVSKVSPTAPEPPCQEGQTEDCEPVDDGGGS